MERRGGVDEEEEEEEVYRGGGEVGLEAQGGLRVTLETLLMSAH